MASNKRIEKQVSLSGRTIASQALLQTSGMLKCEGVMNFDLVGQNLTMSGLIIAIIGKKNWSEVWLRGFITHEPRYPWCDIIISTKPSPRSLILVCSINWRISQWMYLMMKKTKIPVCRPDETYIYCIGLQQYHRVAHFVKCVTKAIYGQLVEPATCQMD